HRARAAGGGDALARRRAVEAAGLVREHRDVLAGEVDDLVIGRVVRHRVDLVDLAVAVVVEPVAGLVAGRLGRAVAAVAARLGVVADRVAVRVRAGDGVDGAGLTDLERLVGHAVAVVVQAVAALGRVFEGLVAGRIGARPALLPLAHRLHARADTLGEAGDG